MIVFLSTFLQTVLEKYHLIYIILYKNHLHFFKEMEHGIHYSPNEGRNAFFPGGQRGGRPRGRW